MRELIYLDASSLVKLVVEEAESSALRAFVADSRRHATSRIGVIETARACLRRPELDADRLEAVLDRLEIVEIDPAVGRRAATLRPPGLRTLDAVHAATALELGADLAAFVTYDTRQAEAGAHAGLPVVSPA